MADYHLRVGDDPTPLSSAAIFGALPNLDDLKLCTTSVLGGQDKAAPSSWDFGKVQFQSFGVKSIKGFGRTSEMLLGIDENRIHITKKKSGAAGKGKVTRCA